MINKENNFAKDINVPHKEQIICKYKYQDDKGYNFKGKPYCTCFNELCEDISIVCDHNCQIYEDFKQLARKTQECEEYKKRAVYFKDVNKQLGYKYLTIKQECEELLKENQQLRNSLSDSLMFKFTGQENETNRYRKALEEIEAATKINCEEICGRKFTDCKDTSCFSANILDIINKAKGEK